MKADAALAPGIDVLLDQFGEDIESWPDGAAIAVPVRAIVEPEEAQNLGNLMVNTIVVTVSKTQVPGVVLQHHRFRVLSAQPFVVPGEYVVADVLSDTGTHFDLRCVK